MSKITLVENGKEIRQAFIENFTMTQEEFKVSHKEWIDALATKNYTVTYEELYLWDLIISEFFENEDEMAKFQKWREEYEEKERVEKEEKAKKKAGAANVA